MSPVGQRFKYTGKKLTIEINNIELDEKTERYVCDVAITWYTPYQDTPAPTLRCGYCPVDDYAHGYDFIFKWFNEFVRVSEVMLIPRSKS